MSHAAAPTDRTVELDTRQSLRQPLRPPSSSYPWLQEVRIGDAERSASCDELAAHYAAGRLDRLELDERMALAVQARTSRDLADLTRDLPPLQVSATGAAPVAPTQGRHPQPQQMGALQTIASTFFGLISFCALGCTLLLLLVTSGSHEAVAIHLAAFGAAVAASGITYFGMLLRGQRTAPPPNR